MVIRYLLRYTLTGGLNWSSMRDSFNTIDTNRWYYREFAPLIHYCFLGIENKTLYYASPQGGRGEVSLRIKNSLTHTSECGLQIKLVVRAEWWHVPGQQYSHGVGRASLCQFALRTADDNEIRMILERAGLDTVEQQKILIEFNHFINQTQKHAQAKQVTVAMTEEHYFNLEMYFDQATQTALLSAKPVLLQEPISRCVISNAPLASDFLHPEINGADSRAMEILLGKISTANDTSRLDELCNSIFTAGTFARETVFIVNNPDPSGQLIYPGVFYMPRSLYIDEQDATKYLTIRTVPAAQLENGIYSFKSAGEEKWERLDVETALSQHRVFYTAREAIDYVDAKIKERFVNVSEIDAKTTKLVSEAKVQQYRYNAELTKNTSNNILMVTGAISAICALLGVILKARNTNSVHAFKALTSVSGFMPGLATALAYIGGWWISRLL